MSGAAGPEEPAVGEKAVAAAVVNGSAQARLERIIGRALAQQLVTALTPPPGRRSPSSP